MSWLGGRFWYIKLVFFFLKNQYLNRYKTPNLCRNARYIPLVNWFFLFFLFYFQLCWTVNAYFFEFNITLLSYWHNSAMYYWIIVKKPFKNFQINIYKSSSKAWLLENIWHLKISLFHQTMAISSMYKLCPLLKISLICFPLCFPRAQTESSCLLVPQTACLAYSSCSCAFRLMGAFWLRGQCAWFAAPLHS